FPAVDDQRLLARLDRPLEPAMDAVVLQEQCQVLGVGKVVNRGHFKVLGSFRQDAEDQPANPAESVDTYSNGHSRLLDLREGGRNRGDQSMRRVVRPGEEFTSIGAQSISTHSTEVEL